jgi:pimeloyl-ACP methyl ester carboxylesterase
MFVLFGQYAPTLNNINYTSGSSSFSVSWSHNPSIAGNYSFSYYQVREVNTSQYYTAYSKSKSFSGKSTGTYTYQVRAVYSYDLGEPLDPSLGIANLDISSGIANLDISSGIANKIYSSWSNQKSVTVTAPVPAPATPSLYSVTASSSSQINLSWQNVSNESGYYIYRSTSSGGTYSHIVTLGANSTSYSNTGLSANTTYYYKVRAYNSTGTSSYSSYKSATTQAPPVTKEVVWAHGYNSSNTFWNDFAMSFQNERNMTSRNPSYANYMGLADSEWQLRSNFNTASDDRIIVGHSLGGVLARQIEMEYPNQYFGGIISVGSPHQGAPIAKNAQDGALGNMTTETLLRLSLGPFVQGRMSINELFKPAFATILTSIFGNILVNHFAPDNSKTTNDLKPNSAALNKLNSATLNVPKIGIYGREYHNNHFRLGATAVGWDEESTIHKVNRLAAVYEAFSNENFFFSTLQMLNYIYYEDDYYLYLSFLYGSIGYAWYLGERTLEDWSQDDWNKIIGNSENLESDGFIPVSSQLMPDAIANLRADGANHLEQGKHRAVRLRLNQIFDRTDDFNVDKR